MAIPSLLTGTALQGITRRFGNALTLAVAVALPMILMMGVGQGTARWLVLSDDGTPTETTSALSRSNFA